VRHGVNLRGRMTSRRRPNDTTYSGIPRTRHGYLGLLSRFSGIGLWVVVIAAFSIALPDTFPTSSNAQNIASSQAITLILAVGLLPALSAGVYDLSAAQNVGLAAVVSSALMVHSGLSPVVAVLVTLGIGVTIGLANGVLIAIVGVDSFIATLGMSSVLLALTEKISNNVYIGPLPASFDNIVSHEPLGVPILTVFALIVAAVVWYILEHTPPGRRAVAMGFNRDAARLTGVRTTRYIIGVTVVSGVLSSLAGVLLAADLGTVSNTLGPSYLLPAFSACFLGTTQLKPGRFNVWGTVIALYLIETGVNGLQLDGAQQWVTDLFYGVALIGAVSIAVIGQRRRRVTQSTVEARGDEPPSPRAEPESVSTTQPDVVSKQGGER
jgi:ribose transport system permease protein